MIRICEPGISRDVSTTSLSRLHSSNRTMDVRHLTCSIISRDMKGPSFWRFTPSLGGSGGAFLQCDCPEPFSTHHCSPSPIGVAVLSALLCTIHLIYWEHISVLQSSYLLFAMPTLSPRTPLPFVVSSLHLCQVVGFHGGLFLMSLSRNPWPIWNVDIILCS